MKHKLIFAVVFLMLSINCPAQSVPNSPAETVRSSDPIEKISGDLSKISKSVAELNKKLKDFFDTFTTNQGLRLTDKQQKMLLAFEILNRAEQRLATLIKLRIELVEKQNKTNGELGRADENLRDENIERGVSLRGTLNADESRESRRRTINAERNNLRNLLNEIQKNLAETNNEISQTEILINNIRPRLFRQIEQELLDF
jgi:peptidoglycan hydrolase CwlO-like protein